VRGAGEEKRRRGLKGAMGRYGVEEVRRQTRVVLVVNGGNGEEERFLVMWFGCCWSGSERVV
jgi:hypothetical protein